MKTYYKIFKACGSIESLVQLELLLALINKCTTEGRSRTIHVNVDGTGSADVRIYVNEKEKDKEMKLVEFNMGDIKYIEHAKYAKFFGDDEKAAASATDYAMERFEKDLDKLEEGHDIKIHIGE